MPRKGGVDVTAAIIALSVLLLVTVLALARAGITVEYREALRLKVTFLGIPLWRYPQKKKAVRVSDYTPEKLRRRELREKKRNLRRLKRKHKQLLKQKKAPSGRPPKKRDLGGTLKHLRKLLTLLIAKTAGYARLRIDRLIITVGSEDAAKTAVLFGAVNQAAILLLELPAATHKPVCGRRSRISVKPDFTATECTADLSLSLSLRVWQMVVLLFHALCGYLKSKTIRTQKSKRAKAK